MLGIVKRLPSLPYILPFAQFVGFLGLNAVLRLSPLFEYPLRMVMVTLILPITSRQTLSLPARRLIESTVVGVAVFVIWVAPDLIWPSYRNHWLFENTLIGTATSSIPTVLRSHAIFLAFRLFGTAVVVPIIEELFWRGWLMRYLINSDFRAVPLGTYSATSFCVTAIMFASEHGSFWDVGLIAGIVYNWWMLQTKSLVDCILAHAVTNASLAIYVVGFQQWQYWL